MWSACPEVAPPGGRASHVALLRRAFAEAITGAAPPTQDLPRPEIEDGGRTHGPPPAGGNRDRRHAATPRWLPDPCAGPHTSRPAAVPGLTRRTPPRHARFCARHRGRDRFRSEWKVRNATARHHSQATATAPPSRRGPSRPARLHRPQNRGPRRAWLRGEVSRNLGGRGAPTAASELAGISSGPGSSGTVTARF